MLIKMVALGVSGYLSNHWNKFDVFVNSAKLLDYVLASLGIPWEISRALGPVRLVGRVTSMRAMVKVLLDTVPMLANVLILYIFIVHIFAVVAVQLWAGQLLNRCFLGEDIPAMYNMPLSPYYMSSLGEKVPFICSPDNRNGMLRCSDVPPYIENGKICSLPAPHHVSELVPAVAGGSSCVNWNMYYNICRAGDLNPHLGAVSFDNIGFAWATIFQIITLEGWAEIMFFIMDAYSFWSFVFFLLVTIAQWMFANAIGALGVLKARNIRVLLKTIMKTLSQVGNICLLFMFFFFIYDALGVELFGKLECSEDNPCMALNRHANFKHFGTALLTLYQVCTGDNWNIIMKDTLRECCPKDHNCSSYLSWVSPIYYSTFAVTAQFVLVNLVVAAIMQALEDSNMEEEAVDTAPALLSTGESGTSSSTS
ncbi:voltage-dependent T-type calcium channel subunit alpha-1H-like, partial [Morone saxatilis]|uniref:voltage-dependent T-type calcium channel subunit alpha-1H-like n=1 Tax=Morone saxatilis TaxID=34816 RepID=UPI0015E1E8AE